jgi:hypothetical protein
MIGVCNQQQQQVPTLFDFISPESRNKKKKTPVRYANDNTQKRGSSAT